MLSGYAIFGTALSLILVASLILLNIGLNQAFAVTGLVPERSLISDKGNLYNNLSDAVINTKTGKLYVVEALRGGVYVTGTIGVHNASTFELITTIEESYSPYEIVLNPVSGFLYVSHSCNCPQSHNLTVIDGATDRPVETIENVAGSIIFVNPILGRIYAANDTAISVIDGASNRLLSTTRFTDLNHPIQLMTIQPSLNLVYGVLGNNTITAIDLTHYARTSFNVTLSSFSNDFVVGNRIVDMAVNPSTNVIFVLQTPIYLHFRDDEELSFPTYYVGAVDGTSGKVVSGKVSEISGFWFDLAVDPIRNIVYAMSGNNVFIAIDGSTNQLIDNYYFELKDSLYVRKMLVNPDTNTLYFLGGNGFAAFSGTNIVPEFPVGFVGLAAALGFISIMLTHRQWRRTHYS